MQPTIKLTLENKYKKLVSFILKINCWLSDVYQAIERVNYFHINTKVKTTKNEKKYDIMG